MVKNNDDEKIMTWCRVTISMEVTRRSLKLPKGITKLIINPLPVITGSRFQGYRPNGNT